ncbi:invasion associated locus B family protein [Devosia rhizoryzae]|uniref:Invasion associated locus B family protein n=1 Tax=Devosia rhizoryzae TaxID=2774137 RepID=A0ABX7CAH5_9HYPH|nr:invasion associated locus B family protein [Devosia rhizoryzae]QQR40682.1 invasion associated locus B family protein [Devosia rhizoryzae]
MNFSKPLVAGFTAAALMLSPLSVFAQETTNTTETPAAETPAAAAPAEGGAVDEVAAAVNNLASQNWLKVCDPLDDGQKACLLRQVVLANGQFLGSFLLRDDPGQESRLLAVAAVPLGVLLPFGLTWQIDNAKPVRVPYMLCDTMSCSAQLVINEQYVNSLKRGGKLVLTAKNRQNQDLAIEINLSGFTASYDSDEALTFEQLQQQESGQNALEQVLQDRAEQLRQELSTDGTTPPADGAATPAPAGDGAAAPAEGTAAPAPPAQ